MRGGGNQLRFCNVAAAMIAVFNPYFLDGIAWKYDSPGMALSILFPLIPFLFLNTRRLYSLASFFGVLGVYMSYQSSSGIYIMMVIFVALLKYITSQWTLEKAAKYCAKSAVAFILASAFFYLIIVRLLSLFLAEAPGSANVAIGLNALLHVGENLFYVWRDFNWLWKALSLLVIVAAAFGVCRVSKKEPLIALPLFGLACALAFVLFQGSYIFLADYYLVTRSRYGFGALLAILASVSVLNVTYRKILMAVPAIALSWSFMSYASAFGNAVANQMKMELQYEALVRQDINELFSYDERPEIAIQFVGNMPWSGEAQNLVKIYPITKDLAQKRYNEFLAHNSTLRYFDPTLKSASVNVDEPGERALTLLVSRRYYDICIEEASGAIIVQCKMK